MTIAFLTKQYEVCQRIAERMKLPELNCMIFRTLSDMHQYFSTKKKFPDMMIFDYMMYNHDFVNPYEEMKNMNMNHPLIFYNDPYPDNSSRAAFWEYQIMRTNPGCTIQNYRKYLSALERAVQAPDIFPYISLIQPPKPFPDPAEESGDVKNVTPCTADDGNGKKMLYSLRKKHCIPKSVFSVLEILYNNMEYPISMEDLLDLLSSQGKSRSRNSINICLSKLRAILKSEDEYNMDLVTDHNGYRLILL